tara:strand:- start:83 stop:640 length:558 start_codon:yes stop_codon:yes gene_type:complete
MTANTIDPIALETKLSALTLVDGVDDMNTVLQRHDTEEVVVPVQAAIIAKLWLSAARDTISHTTHHHQISEEIIYYDEFDVYNVQHCWAEDEEIIQNDSGSGSGSGSGEHSNENEDEQAPTICRAVAKFDATEETELGFEQNSLIAVTDEDASGWWYGVLMAETETGESAAGWFPSTYVQVLMNA